MSNDYLNLPLHGEAASLIDKLSNECQEALRLQTKMLAHQDKVNEGQTKHVEDAYRILHEKRNWSRGKEAAKIFGGALLGRFIAGLEQVFTGGSVSNLEMVILMAIGISGVSLVFAGLRR